MWQKAGREATDCRVEGTMRTELRSARVDARLRELATVRKTSMTLKRDVVPSSAWGRHERSRRPSQYFYAVPRRAYPGTGKLTAFIGLQQSNASWIIGMESANTTVVLGIPIPSTDHAFLALVGVHVLLGLGAVISGAIAMLSNKERGRHSNWGTTYFWCLGGVFITMSGLSIARWTENSQLFLLGALSFVSALVGRTAVRWGSQRWLRLHLCGMGVSYILLLTGFYVDNAKNLPLWKELPELAMWLLPALVGMPILVRALFWHPLVRGSRRWRRVR
jgi:hypothetical protein